MDSRPWYETYFGADYLKTHRTQLTRSTAGETDFVVSVLGLKPGASVLDVPCGHGRHSLELARRGFAVTGVDLSQDFLQLGRRQARSQGVEVRFMHGDMRSLEFEEEFDAAINLFNSFGYFGREGDLQVLRGISRALKPGGRFLLEQGNRDYYLLYAHPTSWEELLDCYVLYKFAFHASSGVAHTQQIIIDKDTHATRTYDISIRTYTFPELSELMRQAELRPYDIYGDWDGSAFTAESPKLIVAAIKSDV